MEKGRKVDRTTMGVLVVYVCQIEGRPTIKEMKETITKRIEVDTNTKQIKDAVLAVKKRGLLSVNYDTDDRGRSVERFSVKDVRWTNPPELAHMKAVLPKLMETEEAHIIQKEMEGIHEEGQKKGGRLPDIRDYVKYRIKYKIITPVLGGNPDDGGCKLRRLNGKTWIPMNLWMKSALKINLRERNVPVAKTQYLKFSEIFMETKNLVEVACPVAPIAGRPGTGITVHEGIGCGEELECTVSFPTRGFMDEEKFIECLGDSVHLGAKHKEYGLLELIDATKM